MAIKRIEREIVIRSGPNRWNLLIDSLAEGKNGFLEFELGFNDGSLEEKVRINWEARGVVRDTTEKGETDSWKVLGVIWTKSLAMFEQFGDIGNKELLFEAVYSTRTRHGKILAIYICDNQEETLKVRFNLG